MSMPASTVRSLRLPTDNWGPWYNNGGFSWLCSEAVALPHLCGMPSDALQDRVKQDMQHIARPSRPFLASTRSSLNFPLCTWLPRALKTLSPIFQSTLFCSSSKPNPTPLELTPNLRAQKEKE